VKIINKSANLFLQGLLVFLLLTAGGCSSTAEKERMNSPEVVLPKARTAYFNKDYRQVFQLLFPLGASGNAQAQYTLGYLYYHGLGVEKSDRQAMSWIQRAAAQGHKKALRALQK
jgi:TPR repeat protein